MEKKNIEDKIQLDLLSEVDKNGSASQRYLSNRLSIALGLTNTYLNKCIQKGLVKVKQIPKVRYFYYLTPDIPPWRPLCYLSSAGARIWFSVNTSFCKLAS